METYFIISYLTDIALGVSLTINAIVGYKYLAHKYPNFFYEEDK